MSWQLASLLLLGGSTVLLFIGLPVAFSFMAINIVGAILFLGGDAGLSQMLRNSAAAVINFSLTPIPLFVLMGEVLFHTGLALKVIDGIERLVRQVPGRLAVVAVVAGTVFSAISGSTIATTATTASRPGTWRTRRSIPSITLSASPVWKSTSPISTNSGIGVSEKLMTAAALFLSIWLRPASPPRNKIAPTMLIAMKEKATGRPMNKSTVEPPRSRSEASCQDISGSL